MTNRSCFSIGTSPRMRGKPIPPHALNVSSRNIPAYAGKTLLSWLVSILNAEHPRVCGENWRYGVHDRARAGTSPRMRGKPEPHEAVTRATRNIPAYAGKTARGGSCCRVTGEHPRVCGENCADLPVPYEHHGTSPRMRGKPHGTAPSKT